MFLSHKFGLLNNLWFNSTRILSKGLFMLSPWHFHPIFVHFVIALLIISSLLFIIAMLGRNTTWFDKCYTTARWNFWIGLLFAVFTAVTGLIAYFTVPNIDKTMRWAINFHLLFAVLTVLFYVTLAAFLWNRLRKNLLPSKTWTASLVIGIILILITGFLGGRLVFDKGVGVNTTTVTSNPVR